MGAVVQLNSASVHSSLLCCQITYIGLQHQMGNLLKLTYHIAMDFYLKFFIACFCCAFCSLFSGPQ